MHKNHVLLASVILLYTALARIPTEKLSYKSNTHLLYLKGSEREFTVT